MLKVAPARAATGPIASVKATMNMGGNAVDRPRAADDFATIKARMEELRHRRRAERPRGRFVSRRPMHLRPPPVIYRRRDRPRGRPLGLRSSSLA
jgi:hypothetical protein